jgi:hypothetical protein
MEIRKQHKNDVVDNLSLVPVLLNSSDRLHLTDDLPREAVGMSCDILFDNNQHHETFYLFVADYLGYY